MSYDKASNRGAGYMTIDEFLNLLTPGLREYLLTTFSHDKDGIRHPEDLIAHTGAYIESAFHIIGSFGVNAEKVKDAKPPKD